jgi:hypothetical protein
VAEADHRVNLRVDLVVAELLFIVKQDLQVTLPQHHPLKEILEDKEQVPRLQEVTEEAVAVATAVLEVMQLLVMMEQVEQELQMILQELVCLMHLEDQEVEALMADLVVLKKELEAEVEDKWQLPLMEALEL